jgi:hypothetical protein
MPHKFGANASNLMLMPKKTVWRPLQFFFFFFNHVLCKTGRTSGEPTGRTPSIFLFFNMCEARVVLNSKKAFSTSINDKFYLSHIFVNMCEARVVLNSKKAFSLVLTSNRLWKDCLVSVLWKKLYNLLD